LSAKTQEKEARAENETATRPMAVVLRWLMPSVLDLTFLALLFGLSCGALGRLLLRDSDTGWHIRNGQLMLATHSITRVDPFSATFSGKPWFAWEWLYDLVVGVIHQTLGLNGVVFYSAAIIAATFVLTLHFCMRRGANLPVTLVLLVLSMGASAVHFLARPHVLSWLLDVIWFFIIDLAAIDRGREEVRRLYWLPLLTVFWVNVHGAFLVGFVLLGSYLMGLAIEYWVQPSQCGELLAVMKPFGTVTVLCVAASLINPFGYKLHLHVYQYLSDRYLMNRISEFASPNFHFAAQQCFGILLLIAIVILAAAPSKLHPARIITLLFAAFSGLYATRNLPSASLLMTMILAPVASEIISSAETNNAIASTLRRACGWLNSFGARMHRLESQFTGHVWLIAGFLVGFWACAHGGSLGSTQLINAYFEPKQFPMDAVNVLVGKQVREPIFSLDHWGGYLIYRLYPRNRVFIDDRHDFYGDAYIQDYLKAILIQSGWEKVLDDEHVNWIVLPTYSSLANVLRLKPEWIVEHEDPTAILFHRK
jgi:hypothetical protein